MYLPSCFKCIRNDLVPVPLCPCSVTQRYPEELTNVIKSGVVAAVAGLIYGGLPAARYARQRYIQLSQAEIYSSRVEAVVRLCSRLVLLTERCFWKVDKMNEIVNRELVRFCNMCVSVVCSVLSV